MSYAQESNPLSGASIYILTNNGGSSSQSYQDDSISITIQALGGNVAPIIEDATHALWWSDSDSLALTPSARSKLTKCLAGDVPVLESSWLERMSSLRSGEHWSDVDVGTYVAPVVALMYDDSFSEGAEIPPQSSFRRSNVASGLVYGSLNDMVQSPSLKEHKGNDGDKGTEIDEGPKLPNRRKSVRFDAPTEIKPPQSRSMKMEKARKERHIRIRDLPSNLSVSIGETYEYLLRESPDVVEDDAVRRAMELSMLDFALVDTSSFQNSPFSTKYQLSQDEAPSQKKEKTPHEILGVKEDATPAEIRRVYRKKALETHPDREGGSDAAFQAVARAYRTLLHRSHDDDFEGSKSFSSSGKGTTVKLKSSAHWDSELKEHRNLVEELFTNHGENMSENIERQHTALKQLRLRPMEAGSSNVNEKDETIQNSCFYLSLATSYLHGIGAITCNFHGDDCDCGTTEEECKQFGCSKMDALHYADKALQSETALQLKRMIESAVVSSHPEWIAQGMVGEEVQAFSDFLVYVLDSLTLISDWAVVVFDSLSGFVEVYKGTNYDSSEADESWSSTNTITVRYVSGHYQPLLPEEDNGTMMEEGTEVSEEVKNTGTSLDSTTTCGRPNLKKILETLDQNSVFYVVTDGSD